MKRQTIGMIIGLIIQYLLGIGTNLYVVFPASGIAKNQYHIAWTHFLSAAHIIWGTLLFINSIILLYLAIRTGKSNLKIVGWVGFLALGLAGFSGGQFVTTQNNLYSLSMAISFIIAFSAYCWGLYILKDQKN